MKAGDLVDAKVNQLLANHPAMTYKQGLDHVLEHDKGLKCAYAEDREVSVPADMTSHFELMNPINAVFVDEVVKRARQAHKNGTINQLAGELGNLIRAAWAKAASEGQEIGNCVRVLIGAWHPSAPLAAAELATGLT
ncbi:MAG: hypothetical protein ACRERY_17525, partial [Pseudomonas sp.]